MAKYDPKLLEEVLKNKVAADWFAAFDTTRIIVRSVLYSHLQGHFGCDSWIL